MNKLSVGFSRIDITPMLGITLRGAYHERISESILDNLFLSALAVTVGTDTVLLLAVDLLAVDKPDAQRIRETVSKATGLPVEAVSISASHTHTAPNLPQALVADYDLPTDSQPLVTRYLQFLIHRAADAAVMAMADRKPAHMGFGVGHAPNVAFIRRFRMKDGSVRTNPGVNNPDILHPIGDADDRVSVVRFDREGGETIVLTHFANHPDTVGGNKISADWPGFLRETVEKALDNVRCIYFNGAQGDVNHVNVHPTGGWLNGIPKGSQSHAHARYIGRVVAAGVLQAFDKVQYTDVDRLKYLHKTVIIPSQPGDPAEIPACRRFVELYAAGRYEELPYTGMMLTTKYARARRILHLKDGPESFSMELFALRLGPIALIGIPGEPFSRAGRAISAANGWGMVLPICLTNGCEGYFPTQDAYDEGGYEAESSHFAAGVAERIIAGSQALLKELED